MTKRISRGSVLLAAIGVLSKHHGGDAFQPFQPLPLRSSLLSTHHQSTSSLQMTKGNLAGKVVYQRFLYKLSPLSDVPTEKDFTIEERLRFQVGDDGRSMEPLGSKTFLLRESFSDIDDDDGGPPDPSKPHQRVGKILHKATFHEITESETGAESYAANARGIIDDCGIASALYFAAQPQMIQGNVLELSSGIGFGGIMSCIAAGAAMPKPSYEVADDEDKEDVDVDDDDILPTKDKAPVPPGLDKLTLSDSNEEVLNECYKNTRISGFPSDKIAMSLLDWTMPVSRDMKNQFNVILGNDVAYQFPDVKGISRLVAYSLKGLQEGQFIHIGPHTRDTISDLRKKLRSGYKMNVDVGYLELERFDLAPMILDSTKEEIEAEKKLLEEDKGYVMYGGSSKEKFSTFVAVHGEGYDGYNGEFFFPAETGMEGEDKPSRWVGGGNVERDDNYGKPEDPEKGSWILE